MKEFNTLDDFDFNDKTIILRVDINCPLSRDTLELEDDNRIRQIIPTIQELIGQGGKVIILAHQGRPGDWDFASLDKHASVLTHYLGQEVRYVSDLVGDDAVEAVKSLSPGHAIMLMNVRELPYELDSKSMHEHANCELVTKLAPLADFYVNDAFATAHRSQCSLVGFPQVLPSAVGRLMEKELTALTSVFEDPQHPTVFILGGAKFGDSLRLIERALERGIADHVICVGLCANAFLHASGCDLGDENIRLLKDELTPEAIEHARRLLKDRSERILLPIDVGIDLNYERRDVFVEELPCGPILDIGNESVKEFIRVMNDARTIFMSGPAGMIEREEFCMGTEKLLTAMVDTDAFTLIGGGHTVGAAERLGLTSKFSYVSTAGGALETFMLGKPLPAVEALKTCRKI
ncbi:MAG: phosphoglycerate kinase [Euryarchaeota archaeon]|nr:phosphoglycerate kinase [Euryarchaeota archaeon]